MTVVLATFLVAGFVLAATERNITSLLGGQDGDFFNVDGTLMMDSIKIGRQGEGGVTFFNGSIVNQTTNGGVGNPVTFGDDVRIDGEIWRTEKGGNNPIKISDHVVPTIGNTNDFGKIDRRWNSVNSVSGDFSGSIAVGGKVDGVNVSEEVAVTTTNDLVTPKRLTTPSGSSEIIPSRIVSGVSRIDCTGVGIKNITVDLAALGVKPFTAENSYNIIAVDDGVTPEMIAADMTTRTPSSFKLYKNCTIDTPTSTTNWIAIGY